MKVLLVVLAFTVSCTLAKPSEVQEENPSVRWRFCKWFPHWEICQFPFECTATGIFADPNDCHKFIACQDSGDGFFIEHDMSCPHDLVFNPETHRCDHPENVPSCGAHRSVERVNPDLRFRFCQWFPHWDICQFPFECTAEGLFPDPNDCTQFHSCQDAGDGFFIEHDMSCPHDLVFNPETHRCDHIENVPSCGAHRTVEKMSPALRFRFCQWFPHWDICQFPFECTAEGLFSDPNDCTQFHSCQDAGDGFFIEHDMSCPHDLVFNPETHRCDHIENVPSCGAHRAVEKINPALRFRFCQWFPHWDICQFPFECTAEGLFSDPNDCTQFHSCQDAGDGFFIEHDMSCPHDLVFNPETHRCDHLENVPSCQ